MKNLKSFGQYINESYGVNEGVISGMKLQMLGKKLLNKIKIGSKFVTANDEYTVTAYGPKANAFQEYEVTNKGGEAKKAKLTVMYGVKLEICDDPRSARYSREEALQSINESQTINEGIIKKTETITVEHEIEYFIDGYFEADSGMSEEEHAETIANDVSLKKGSILFETDTFEIQGETQAGNNLYVAQDGEYDMYGGPYEPKMGKPKLTLNGKDITSLVMKAFKQYGWDSNMIDISRTDIWGHVIK